MVSHMSLHPPRLGVLLAGFALVVAGCAASHAKPGSAAPSTPPAAHDHGPGAGHGHGHAEGADEAPLVANGEAKAGDVTTCPVSGERFVVKDDSPRVEYQGKTYYTCCEHCHAELQQDPAKFLGQGPGAPAAK
jgi:Cu+-exporting ATPase